MCKLAPIVIFTYRRVIDKTIESLLHNELAKNSELYIFSDGNKNEIDLEDVIKTRKYLQTIDGFKNIKIIESSNNKGLADSIIAGVREVLNKYDKVIVLEDDLIVSDDFLEYMNDALRFYEKDERIWSISGYGPKLPCLKNYKDDLYLSVRASSWGWATWKDRWNKVDWKVKDFVRLKQDKSLQSKFNLGGNDMYKMLELQMLGKIDSWAIRWCFSQFIFNSLTVYPSKSKVINIGFGDEKGIHNNTLNEKWMVKLNNNKICMINMKRNLDIEHCFKEFYDLSLKTKIGYFLKKYVFYKEVKTLLRYINKRFIV